VLVHDAYLRLVEGNGHPEWNGRGHFFAAAAEAMRRILVENARMRRSLKRGGALQREPIAPDEIAMDKKDEELLDLHEALQLLEEKWPDKAHLVKLRYFAGMTVPEAAVTMKISLATAERHWAFAKAWLYAQLKA
jgi:RNA polymerase sigma factor (TIGR02999 family)